MREDQGASARIIDRPHPGFFTVRLTKGGPACPAVIYRPCPMVLPMPDTDEGEPGPGDWCRPIRAHWRPLEAMINDEPASVNHVWTSGREIGQGEYEFLLADYLWAVRWAQSDPRANPREKIDLAALPPVF